MVGATKFLLPISKRLPPPPTATEDKDACFLVLTSGGVSIVENKGIVAYILKVLILVKENPSNTAN